MTAGSGTDAQASGSERAEQLVDNEMATGLTGSARNTPLPMGAVRRWLLRLGGRRLAADVGWVTGSFIANQIVRLGTNLILARLLAPQLFGIMLIINTVRTGIELLTDVGISQNIIANPAGDEPRFVNTAWTLQLIRGVLLCLVVLLFSAPVADLYDEPILGLVLPLMSITFLLTGLSSPALSLLVKHGRISVIAAFELAMSVVNLMINVGLALYSPTIWALIFGVLITTAIHSIATFFLLGGRRVRLQLDKAAVREILTFGKWIFASSLVLFLAMNFDRLYFAKVVSLSLLGIYGVARTFSDTAGLLVQRISNMLVFPKIAALGESGSALRDRIARTRAYALTAVAVGLSFAIAASDQLILVLYDPRYHSAAFMLPILMTGVWFSVLATLGDAVMLGTGRPAHAASANALKLVWTVIALPLTLPQFGFAGALAVLVLADLVRYLWLSVSQHSQRLSFLRQDFSLTLLLASLVVAWRLILDVAGLVPDLDAWWALGAELRL